MNDIINPNELNRNQIQDICQEYIKGYSFGVSDIAKICPYSSECAAGKAWQLGYGDGIRERDRKNKVEGINPFILDRETYKPLQDNT